MSGVIDLRPASQAGHVALQPMPRTSVTEVATPEQARCGWGLCAEEGTVAVAGTMGRPRPMSDRSGVSATDGALIVGIPFRLCGPHAE